MARSRKEESIETEIETGIKIQHSAIVNVLGGGMSVYGGCGVLSEPLYRHQCTLVNISISKGLIIRFNCCIYGSTNKTLASLTPALK